MSNIVLSVENLYKQYRLGTVGTGTMRDDLARFWAKIRGKEDPNLKIGEVNDRNSIEGDYVWALQDINFEVKQGEVLGIIGKNGAGKSTLLKILSKVTSPTKGQIKTKGRIASLLEVGTGFHPELTGRENIFLNGAILGMTKNDIRSKFDEIVEFSGIGKYIDTPVKRYSSGMYVRLAFAVAAHLEPEILIIDEVLAVGDAEFQKKCLGKMKDVSGQGRTVLFVSHDMRAVRNLCTECVLMKNGGVEFIGDTKTVIENYLTKKIDFQNEIPNELSTYNTGEAKFKYIDLLDTENNSVKEVLYRQKFFLKLSLQILKEIKNPILDIKINTPDLTFITYSMETKIQYLDVGSYEIIVQIDNDLIPGNYAFTLGIHKQDGATIDYVENIYPFAISDFAKDKSQDYPYQWKHGFIVADSIWSVNKVKKEIIA